ncbi:MAG: hypothetical protein ACTSPN_00635 [Promethearchaeota archaeon]
MKKSVMTREEIDERILNRIPHSGCHNYDGIFFLTGLLASRRRKKREILEKLKLSREQKQAGIKMESPKEVQKLETIIK